MHDVGSSCSVRGTPCVLKGDRIYVHCGMYGFCVQSIRRGNWYRYANHCSVRFYINFAKSREENRSRIARYWLPRSKECADLHDVSSSFVRELKRNNKQTNKQTNIQAHHVAGGGPGLTLTLTTPFCLSVPFSR